MERNVGGVDRGLRIIVGAALVAWAALSQSDLHAWGFVGVIPLATGILGWCPAYLPFGWKTCRAR